VVLGDGELQEGMTWEAIHVAARYRLGKLTAIVDQNGLQQYGWDPEIGVDRGDRGDPWRGFSLPAMFEAFGWRVIELDGHDFEQIEAAYSSACGTAPDERPVALIARTVKGRGLSFAEGRHTWHTGVASDAELEQARRELEATDISGVTQ
jgi:transketolase